jgi:hypothetical protein
MSNPIVMMEIEVARQLVLAWHRNGLVYPAVKYGLLEAGVIPSPEGIRQQIGASHNLGSVRAKAFFADRWSMVSEALWNCMSDEKVVSLMLRTRPDPRMRHQISPAKAAHDQSQSRRFIELRQLDRKHDWKTVK